MGTLPTGSLIDVVSSVLGFFLQQSQGVQEAMIRAGAGKQVQDASRMRMEVQFGQETRGEKSSAGPPRAGQQSRTTESRRGSGRVA